MAEDGEEKSSMLFHIFTRQKNQSDKNDHPASIYSIADGLEFGHFRLLLPRCHLEEENYWRKSQKMIKCDTIICTFSETNNKIQFTD